MTFSYFLPHKIYIISEQEIMEHILIKAGFFNNLVRFTGVFLNQVPKIQI